VIHATPPGGDHRRQALYSADNLRRDLTLPPPNIMFPPNQLNEEA
jgi:hypothetical protein